jgi:hypothetical protein
MDRHRCQQCKLRSGWCNGTLDRLLILVTHTVSRPILDTAFTLLFRFGESMAHVSVPCTRRIFARGPKKLLQRNVKRLTNLFKSLCHAFNDASLHFIFDELRNLLFHGFSWSGTFKTTVRCSITDERTFHLRWKGIFISVNTKCPTHLEQQQRVVAMLFLLQPDATGTLVSSRRVSVVC